MVSNPRFQKTSWATSRIGTLAHEHGHLWLFEPLANHNHLKSVGPGLQPNRVQASNLEAMVSNICQGSNIPKALRKMRCPRSGQSRVAQRGNEEMTRFSTFSPHSRAAHDRGKAFEQSFEEWPAQMPRLVEGSHKSKSYPLKRGRLLRRADASQSL